MLKQRLVSLVFLLLTLLPAMAAADHLQVGKDFYELRRFTDALASLKLAIQEDQQNWEALFYTGLIYQESGKPDLAQKFYASAWRAKPGNDKVGKLLKDAHLTGAARARAAGGVDLAVKELEGAFKAGFFCTDIANQLLAHYAEQQKYESMITVGSEVLRRHEELTLYPRDGSGTKRTHFLVGRAYFETHAYEKALEHLEIATVASETGAKEYWDRTQQALAQKAAPVIRRAEELYKQGAFREARTEFEKGLKLHRDNPFARKMLLKIDNVVKAQDLETRAGTAVERGNPAEALELLREAVLLYPENTSLMERIKEIQARSAALEASRAAREEATEKARRDKQEQFAALVQSAQALEEKEKYTEAQAAYADALKIFPDDTSIKKALDGLTARVEMDQRYKAGVALFDEKKWADAIKELRTLDEKSESGFRGARRVLALCFLNLRKIDEFEKYALLSLEKDREDVELLYLLGQQAADGTDSTARLKEASARFKQVAALNPSYKDVAERLKTLHWKIYWPEYAVAAMLVFGYLAFYVFMKQKPRLMKRIFLKDLDRLVGSSNWSGAMELHTSSRAYELDNREALQVHTHFARSFFEGKQYGKAVSEAQQALRIAPRNKELRVLLGRAYYASKIISQEILDYYLDLLETDPENRNLLAFIGNFCTDKKILNPTTMALLRQLAQVQPENDKVRNLLLKGCLKDNDRSAAAMAIYRLERERNPENLDVRVIFAEEHLRRGDNEKAIDECEEMLNVNVNHPKTHQVLIDAYTKLGKLPELAKSYQTILEGAPHNTFIQSMLAKVTGVQPPPMAGASAQSADASSASQTSERTPSGRSAAAATPVRGNQKCPKCGAEVPVGSYFCSCGSPL